MRTSTHPTLTMVIVLVVLSGSGLTGCEWQTPGQSEQNQAYEDMKRQGQCRESFQPELVSPLPARFQRMLQLQQAVTRETKRLSALPMGQWTQADQQSARKAAEQEAALADMADQALTLLREDGTSIILPKIVEPLRDEMLTICRRLTGNPKADPVVLPDLGHNTHELQEDAERTLAELAEGWCCHWHPRWATCR